MDRFIELDSPFLDILFEQIVDAEELDVFIRKPFLETKPGRKVGVPSFWQDEIFAPQFLVIFYNPPDDCFHRFVVAREKAPVYAFPVLGSGRPGLVGGIQNSPPVHHVLGFAERLFGVNGEKVFCPFLVDRDFEAGKFFRKLRAKIFEQEKKVFLGDTYVIPPIEAHLNALMENAGYLVSFPLASGRTKHCHEVDSHGAGMFAPAAKGAKPGESRIDQFLIHAQQSQANGFPHVQTVHAGDRAPACARAAGEAQVGVLGRHFALFTLCK
jgi:hypothetical protein